MPYYLWIALIVIIAVVAIALGYAFVSGGIQLTGDKGAKSTPTQNQPPPGPGVPPSTGLTSTTHGIPIVISEGQTISTATGAKTQVVSTILYPNPGDPEHATDPRTGRNFHWDEDAKAWVNSQTGESTNVAGHLIPPDTTPQQGPPNPGQPVVISEGQTLGTLTGAETQVLSTVLYPDASDPSHATDPRTGRNFHWDEEKKAWVNSQNGEVVNVDGIMRP